MFRGVDRALFVAAFAQRARAAGLTVGVGAVERGADALDRLEPRSVDDYYWPLRITFVGDPSDIEVFDRLFDAVFDTADGFVRVTSQLAASRTAPAAPNPSPEGQMHRLPITTGHEQSVPWTTLPVTTGDDSGASAPPDSAVVFHDLVPTSLRVDADQPFDQLDPDQLDEVARWMTAVARAWPTRRTRRRRPASSGNSIALRRSLRDAQRTGGELLRFASDRPTRRPRRLVVIADVSGSMEVYSRLYLHLARPLALRNRGEVFAFSTRLTRVTNALRERDAHHAIERLTDEVGDRFSGTRIASSLGELIRHPQWSQFVRGAVVVICSDGWETDDPERLGAVMARIALLAHRIVWVNPRVAAAGFEPTTAGMSAALPHVDRLLAGNTARSMADVMAAIADGTSQNRSIT